MPNAKLRYDNYLSNIDAAELKKIANLWGGGNKLRKDEAIQYLHRAFADPQKIDAAIDRMHSYERAALGLLKLYGGVQDLSLLSEAIRVTGTLPDTAHTEGYSRQDSTGRLLVERGIVMAESGSRYINYGYGSTRVFADDRVLARIQPLEHVPLRIVAAQPPSTSTVRRAQSLVLDVIAVVRAVDEIDGIGYTKTGELRVNDLRKFTRKMGWGDRIEFDGLPFPEPAPLYLSILLTSGLLTRKEDCLVGAAGLEQIGSRPVGELIRGLVHGILEVSHWVEYDAGQETYRIRGRLRQGRVALLVALCCLPTSRAWFRFDDFERALFDRVGNYFSITGNVAPPYSFNKSPAQRSAELEQWRHTLRANWEKIDVVWLQAAFRTWLYAFGLVELSLADGNVERFRLTDAAYVALLHEPAAEVPQAPTEQTSAWVVQPNFDVVVYLDSASTEQVAFLEQVAERVNLAQHTAQYRLTRDSVYEGIQRGIDVDRLIATIAAGSRLALPGNVVAEIRTWAALRERIIVQRQADLLEFPDAAARQRALDRGIVGLAVGERFLLMTRDPAEGGLAGVTPETIDYANKNVPRCLQVSEDGLITLSATRRDLFTAGYLDLWAERKSDTTWQLTHERIADMIRRGRTLRELLALLQDRLTDPLPGILKVALRAWAGETIPAGLAEAVILQCTQSEALEALVASKTLKPHLLGRIGPDTVLIKSGSQRKVREILDWAGLQTSTRFVPPRF